MAIKEDSQNYSREHEVRELFLGILEEGGVIGLDELDTVEMPPIEYIMLPWLATKQVNILHAEKGSGKSMLATAMAVAITHGLDIGYWKTIQPMGCLYIDGEINFHTMRERVQGMAKGHKAKAPLKVISNDVLNHFHDAYINLSDPGIRHAISDYLDAHKEYRVLFIDNKASLCPYGDENAKSDYDAINQWLLHLKRQDRTVFLIHHSNKKGGARGTSAIADNPENMIIMKKVGAKNGAGLATRVQFEKYRACEDDDVPDFIFMLHSKYWEDDEGIKHIKESRWEVEVDSSSMGEEIVAALKDGMSVKAISQQLGCSESTIYRHKKRAEDKGILLETF